VIAVGQRWACAECGAPVSPTEIEYYHGGDGPFYLCPEGKRADDSRCYGSHQQPRLETIWDEEPVAQPGAASRLSGLAEGLEAGS